MTEREAKLQAVALMLLQEPTQIAVPFMDGPHLTEREIDEWVCQHCGNHGDAADMIEHADDCSYVAIKAALWPSGTTITDKIGDGKRCDGCNMPDSSGTLWVVDRVGESYRLLCGSCLRRDRDALNKRNLDLWEQVKATDHTKEIYRDRLSGALQKIDELEDFKKRHKNSLCRCSDCVSLDSHSKVKP